MSDLRAAAAQYLQTRRALGYQLTQQGQLLADFVEYLQAAGAEHVSVDHAVAWARTPAGADPVWWNAKLCVVRGFARWLRCVDPATEVPPAGLFPARYHRPTPYIYRPGDIDALLAAAGRLNPPFRADTYQTLFALLVVSGMRVGEAVGLDRGDVDADQGLLTIRRGKNGKARQLGLHPSSVAALRGYCARRDAQFPTPAAPSFFVSTRGTWLIVDNVCQVFPQLVREAGLARPGRRPPRLHDARHSFAVRIILGWYQEGADVDARLPLLSTWLGHTGPASTYWYLSTTPELLTLITERLEHHHGGQP
jgi:integrase/recombinase XerD